MLEGLTSDYSPGARLEQETGLFFDLKYFERLVMAGKLDQVDRYLEGFTNLNDDRNSLAIFFEIRRQKYLEALERYVVFSGTHSYISDLLVSFLFWVFWYL